MGTSSNSTPSKFCEGKIPDHKLKLSKMEVLRAKIVEINNSITVKKTGSKGSMIIMHVTHADKSITIETKWSNDPSYSSAYRDIEVFKDDEGYWQMVGNFITQAELVTMKANALANARALAVEDED